MFCLHTVAWVFEVFCAPKLHQIFLKNLFDVLSFCRSLQNILVVFKNVVVTYVVCCNGEKLLIFLNFSLLMNVVLLMASKTLRRFPFFHLQQLTYINISLIFESISIIYFFHTMSSLSNITSLTSSTVNLMSLENNNTTSSVLLKWCISHKVLNWCFKLNEIWKSGKRIISALFNFLIDKIQSHYNCH